jgi:hypothetical protein
MIRHRERMSQSGLGSGIIVALVIALPLLAMPRVAHADLGDEPSGGNKPGINQASDPDKPSEPTLLGSPKPADAAAQKKAAPAPGEPLYKKWEFWAIVGGAAVVTVLAVLAAGQIAHQINGGDVRECAPGFVLRCYGEGR